MSERIIEAVATETGRQPCEFGPLYDRIDPDALDALFLDTPERSRTRGHVTFPLADRLVVVFADGTIDVRTEDDPAPCRPESNRRPA